MTSSYDQAELRVPRDLFDRLIVLAELALENGFGGPCEQARHDIHAAKAIAGIPTTAKAS